MRVRVGGVVGVVATVAAVAVTVVAQPKFLRDGGATVDFPRRPAVAPQRRLIISRRALAVAAPPGYNPRRVIDLRKRPDAPDALDAPDDSISARSAATAEAIS